jgi:hypothetical protein
VQLGCVGFGGKNGRTETEASGGLDWDKRKTHLAPRINLTAPSSPLVMPTQEKENWKEGQVSMRERGKEERGGKGRGRI